MLKPILITLGLLSFVSVAHAQQNPTSPAQPSGAIQTPAVPDPAVDPDSPPVIRDGRDNDESTEAAEEAAEGRKEPHSETEKD